MLRIIFSHSHQRCCLATAANSRTANAAGRIPVTGMSMNPYALYVKEQFDKKTPLVANKENIEAFKSVSAAWKKMGDSEKKIYKEKSNAFREEKIAEFKRLPEEEQKLKLEESIAQKQEKAKRKVRKARREEWESTGHPAIPPNAYALFISAHFEAAKKSGKSTSNVTEHVAEAAKAWKTTSEAQKKKYTDEAKQLRDEYEVKVAQWKKENKPKKESKKMDDSARSASPTDTKKRSGSQNKKTN